MLAKIDINKSVPRDRWMEFFDQFADAIEIIIWCSIAWIGIKGGVDAEIVSLQR